MIRILWTALALQDLQGISAYIERRGSLASANRVCRSIYETVQRLRRVPEMGKAGLEDATRELVVPDYPAYIIAYRLATHQKIEILRIWHGAQDRS